MNPYSDCTESTSSGDQVMTLRCFPSLIHNIINFGFSIAGTVALIFIIYSGFKMIRSSGDPKQFDSGRQTLIYAIIGLLVVILAAAIVNFISVVANVPCLNVIGFDTCK